MKPEVIPELIAFLTDTIRNGLVNHGLDAAKDFICSQLAMAIATQLPVDQANTYLLVEAEQHYDRDLKPTVNRLLGQIANGLEFDHGVCGRMVRQVWITRWTMCYCPNMMAKSLYTVFYLNGTFPKSTIDNLERMGVIRDLETTESLYHYRTNNDLVGHANSLTGYTNGIMGLVSRAMQS